MLGCVCGEQLAGFRVSERGKCGDGSLCWKWRGVHVSGGCRERAASSCCFHLDESGKVISRVVGGVGGGRVGGALYAYLGWW